MPVHRATFSLTGWGTDVDGNLVNTGGGAIVPGAYADPIIVKSYFSVDGPQDDDEGVFWRLTADVWDYTGTPEDRTLLEANNYARYLLFKGGFNLGWRNDNGGSINFADAADAVNYAGIGVGGSQAGNKPGNFGIGVRDNLGHTKTQFAVDDLGILTLGSHGKQMLLAGDAWMIETDGRLMPSAIGNMVPITPTVQDVVDKLVALGILTQDS